jgi:hypothetical protein
MYSWVCSDSYAVYSTVDTVTLRNVFTTVSAPLDPLMTIIGSLYLKRSGQRILLQKKNGKARRSRSGILCRGSPWALWRVISGECENFLEESLVLS